MSVVDSETYNELENEIIQEENDVSNSVFFMWIEYIVIAIIFITQENILIMNVTVKESACLMDYSRMNSLT